MTIPSRPRRRTKVIAYALGGVLIPAAGIAYSLLPASAAIAGAITGLGGKCIDVAAASSANGTAVQLWECNGTNAQRWTFGTDGSLRALGKCLDIADWGTANGAKVQLWDCASGQSNQTWVRDGSSYRNPASGKCLDNPANGSGNGNRIQIWTCYNNDAQRWSVPGA